MSVGERADEVREEYEDDPILDSEDLDPQGDQVVEPEDYSFPDKHTQAFNGLMYLGALTDEFEFVGHKINIRTLTTDETLGIGLMLKKFEGTIAYERAYATAIVAACVTAVDGQGLPIPLGEGKETYSHLWLKFNYVKSRWFPYTIDHIFSKYLVLEGQVREVFAAMGKASS